LIHVAKLLEGFQKAPRSYVTVFHLLLTAPPCSGTFTDMTRVISSGTRGGQYQRTSKSVQMNW
jgi:hypothetical protein